MARDRKRVCLLTGASGRLGTAFCRAQAHRYDIAAVYRTRPPEVPTQHQTFFDPIDPSASVAENQHPVFAIQSDLTATGELGRVVDLVLARFGRIDLLVNAAVRSVWAPILGTRKLLDSLDAQFLLNAMIPLKLSVEVVDRFWRHRDLENLRNNCNVVNVSSTAGLYVYTGHGQSAYGASKAALNHLTCHTAAEFRQIGIRVNAVAPDSFPSRVATEAVVAAIVRLDEGNRNGQILAFDENGEQWISPISEAAEKPD
jgi:NAD(P)-dependent dehydrogenase (short-subunit alcohol dehydrogenase family)